LLVFEASGIGVASIGLGPSLVGWSVDGSAIPEVEYLAVEVEILSAAAPGTASLLVPGFGLLAWRRRG
jgi:hypothetical protein